MKKLRVLVLTHPDLVPPDSLESRTEQEIDEWRNEYDVVTSLRREGHEVRVLGLHDNLPDLRAAITMWKPDIAFNLLQEFQGIVSHDQYVVAFLELMRQPYTGCNPRGMMLTRDKVLSKQILAYHRVPTPKFLVFRRGYAYRIPRKVNYPLFVKSTSEDASLGISQASIVEDAARLKERIDFIFGHAQTDALVEEYIEGRELYVGIDGNERLTTYPVWEMDFGTLPQAREGIATRKVKWDRKYQRKHGIASRRAEGLPAGVDERLAGLSKRVYRALYMSGYGRMDFRMRPDGSVFLLEANCNPDLSKGEDFADAAEAAGHTYDALLQRVIGLGLRYQAEWRLYE